MTKKILLTIISISCLVAITGCMCSSNKIVEKSITTATDGTIIESEIKIYPPKYPAGPTIYDTAEDGTKHIELPLAQDQANIEKEKGDVWNVRILYMACAGLLILGGIAFAMPNKFVSNKDALILCIIAVSAFAGIRYVESSKKIMGYVLPVMIVSATGWIGYNYYKGKKEESIS